MEGDAQSRFSLVLMAVEGMGRRLRPRSCRLWPRAGPRFSVGRGLYKLEADRAAVVSSGLRPRPSLGAGAHLLLPAHPTLPRPRADRTGQVGR